MGLVEVSIRENLKACVLLDTQRDEFSKRFSTYFEVEKWGGDIELGKNKCLSPPECGKWEQ